MLNNTRDAIIQKISDTWDSLPWDARPWGVWIQQYEPIAPDARELPDSRSLRAVWFLDSRGLREENPWSFLRFIFMYDAKQWCPHEKRWYKHMWGEPHTIHPRYHPIGLAAFAEYQNSLDVYLETIWGGTNGRSDRLFIDDKGRITGNEMLWVS